MTKKNILIASALLVLASTTIHAEEPSYDNVELGYLSYKFDSIYVPKLNGYELNFSRSLSENFYLAGSYASVSDGPDSVSLRDFGVGYKTMISETASFFAEVDWAQSQVRTGTGYTDSGNQLKVGLKSMVAENLELQLSVERLTIDGSTSNSTVFGGAYNISDNMGIYFDYKSESDVDRTSVGVRFNF